MRACESATKLWRSRGIQHSVKRRPLPRPLLLSLTHARTHVGQQMGMCSISLRCRAGVTEMGSGAGAVAGVRVHSRRRANATVQG